jgi:hypothetical protein
MMVMAKNEQKTARLNFQEGQPRQNLRADILPDADTGMGSPPG